MIRIKIHKVLRNKGESQTGFTLIELLISMMVVMTVGSIMLVVFFSALRGTQESKTLIATRQTGNYALSQIGKTIRQAEQIEDFPACLRASNPVESIVVVSSLDHQETMFECTESNIASRSATKEYLLLDEDAAIKVSSCSFTCGEKAGSSLPYIKVQFTLDPAGTSQATSEKAYDFSSVILLRNAALE